MMFRKSLVAALCATSLGAATVPLTANADTRIYFNSAPPELRHEPIPAARRGHTWVPGHWNARNNRHVWQRGHWERHRAGHHYVAPTWVQRERWELQPGRWRRGDRDGDGVRDRVDRAPNDPNRS